MNQTNLLKTMLLLFALMVGSGSAWADTEIFSMTANVTADLAITAESETAWTEVNLSSYATIKSGCTAYGISKKTNSQKIIKNVNAGDLFNIPVHSIAFKITFETELANGDIISAANATNEICFTTTDTRSTTLVTTSGSYTVTSGDGLAGATTIYIWRASNSSSTFTNLTITRSGGGSTSYTVTYDANGAGSGSVPTDSNSPYASGATVTVLGNTGSLAMDGYTFSGWNTAANGSGTSYAAEATFSISSNTTLYAKWAQTVTLNKNGGDTDGSVTTYFNGTANLASDFTAAVKEGYVVTGYYDDAEGTTKVLNADGTFAASTVTGYITDGVWTHSGATTLYAQWEEAIVATPAFRVINGTVEMTCETDGATIKYSTDGGISYVNYTMPLTFLNRTIVKAKAVKDGYTDSGVRTQTVAAPQAKAGSYSITLYNDDSNWTKAATTNTDSKIDTWTGKADTYLEGYKILLDNTGKTGSNIKSLDTGSKINGKGTIKGSNGRELTFTIPEGIKVNRITIYSYTNGDSENNYRTTWKVNGTTYNTETMIGLSLKSGNSKTPECSASKPDVRVFTLNDVTGSFTLNNSGYQQCFYMVLDYTRDGKLQITPAKEYTSFCSEKALDFTSVEGLEAYAVSSVNTEGKQVTMTKVSKAPAGAGLILKKTGGAASYEVPTSDFTGSITNKLVGVTTATAINNVSGHKHYILSDGSFIEAVAGSTLAAGKCYLDLTDAEAPDLSGSARGMEMIFDEGETTGVADVRGKMSDVRGEYFDLQGRKVAQPTKGLYIVNGKKVVIK